MSSAAVAVEEVTRVYRSAHGSIRALDAVTFTVKPGETLAVIGESGCGKSTLLRLVAGLEKPTSGDVRVFGGSPLLKAGLPGVAQLVFQDPTGSLNPYRKVWKSVAEPLRHVTRRKRRAIAEEMLVRLGIGVERHEDLPNQFSGGQLQRIALARALVAGTKLLLCDEPTSALDVSVQAEILNVLRDLQDEAGLTCLFVTHDLAVAQVVCDRVIVLRNGRVIEMADALPFFRQPQDPYSIALLEATAVTYRSESEESKGKQSSFSEALKAERS